MKKKSSYILAGLAIVPIVSVLTINTLSKRTTFYIENEKGSRKEMSGIKLESFQKEGSLQIFDRKVTISADKIETEKCKNNFYKYGDGIVKDNKDFFRGKVLNDRFVGESEKYVCYASVEQKGIQYYIDLYIKDLKSGDIINKKYDLDLSSDKGYYNTNLVKISGGFVNVVLQKSLLDYKSSEAETLIDYKFDLATGDFLKKVDIGENLATINSDNGNIYCSYYDSGREGEEKTESNLIIYNVNNDTIEKNKMPEEFDIADVIENNGGQYIISYEGKVIERTSDGKLKNKNNLINNKPNEKGVLSNIKIKNDKIYAMYSSVDDSGKIVNEDTIKIFELDTGKKLYSGNIMKKSLYDSKGQTARGIFYKFI